MAKSEVKSKRKPRFRRGQVVLFSDGTYGKIQEPPYEMPDFNVVGAHEPWYHVSEIKRALTPTEWRGEGGRRGK